MHNLKRGERYRLTFLPAGAKSKTTTVEANYLGEDYQGNHAFDLRPVAGTSSIRDEAIIKAEHIGPGKFERR